MQSFLCNSNGKLFRKCMAFYVNYRPRVVSTDFSVFKGVSGQLERLFGNFGFKKFER